MNPKPFEMKVGNTYKGRDNSNTETYHPGWRTIKQFEYVRSVVASKEFDFSCSSLFNPESPNDKYQGSFMWNWYDKTGNMHAHWVTATARIKDYSPKPRY